MTTPKYTKKYAIIALAVLLCMSIFVPLLPNLVSAAAPTSATISIVEGKNVFDIGETVTFNVGGDGDRDALWVDYPSGERKHIADLNDETYAMTFDEPGEYHALVETWNGDGSTQSEKISFKVGTPKSASVSAGKTSCTLGESIVFTMSGDGSTNTLWIYKPDGTSEYFQNAGESYTYTPTAAGKYEALVETWNGAGSFCSEKISFVVNAPVVTTTVPTTTPTSATTTKATTTATTTTKATTTATTTKATTTAATTTKATTTAPTTQPGESTTTKMTTTAATTLPPTATTKVTTTKVTTTKATTTNATTTAPVATTEPTQEPSSDPSTDPTAAPTTKPATTTVATTTAAPLVITHPGSNPNPVVTMKQAPLPPDYTGLIVLLIILVILILIALVVFLKIRKRKKKSAAN